MSLDVLGELEGSPDYQNALEGTLSFECKRGHGLYQVESIYDDGGVVRKRNANNDRRWSWRCRKVQSTQVK